MEEVFDQPDKDPRQHADRNPASEAANDNQDSKTDQGKGKAQLNSNDLPDASNESTGKMGSGQRQDSN